VIEYLLIPVAFFTSCLAGVMGLGGGILLIAAMPGLVPATAIIPLHAATQLASNLSRALFSWREIDLAIIPPFLLGAALGGWAGSEIYGSLKLEWVPVVIGVLILVLTWVKLPTPRGTGQWSLVLLGFYQTGLGMVAGATGPLGAAVLQRRNIARDWVVANTAVYMGLNHTVRCVAFVAIGFGFAPWWKLILGMVVAGIAGSWVGTRLRSRVPQVNFQRWFKWLITVLALRMIAWPLWAN